MIKLGLIGEPIQHSLSPMIHSTVMEYLNKPFSYNLYNVKPADLKSFIKTAKEEALTGFNVTMPHKVEIIKYLNEMDSESSKYKSVNTVKNEYGMLYGYNTDADGFIMSFDNEGISLKDKNILILGAGGVTNTIAVKMAKQNPEKIIVLNRTPNKAEALCSRVQKESSIKIDFDKFDFKTIIKHAGDIDILINTTPLGMHGVAEDFENTNFLEAFQKSVIVYDLIYNPRETKLLKNAIKLELKTINGLEMLINQAIIADQIYLKESLDIKSLNKIVKQKLLNL